MDFINHPFRKKQSLLALAIIFVSPLLVSCSQTTETHSAYAGKKAFFLLGEHEYGTPETLPAFALSPGGSSLPLSGGREAACRERSDIFRTTYKSFICIHLD